MFNLAQSFYVDPQSVYKADTVFITSIDLFFKEKPVEGKTSSGISAPGVTLFLTKVVNNSPVLNNINFDYFARKELSEISTSTSAATATKFTFNNPVPVKTDLEYAVLIKFDGSDAGYVLWKNTSGEVDVITGQSTKVSSAKVDGNFFEITNGFSISPLSDVDLKFQVNIAKFSTTEKTYKISNRAFEFFALDATSINGEFIGGEYVYKAQANLSGSVAVTSGSVNVDGTSTTFLSNISNNDLIVIHDQVRKVNVVQNNIFMNVTSAFTSSNASANIVVFETGTMAVDSSSNTVVGTNTTFQTSGIAVGKYIIITDGTSGNTEVRKVVGISSETSMVLDVKPSFSNSQASWFFSPIGRVDDFKAYSASMILDESTANTSLYFQTNDILRGVDSTAECKISAIKNLSLARYSPFYKVTTPSFTKVKYFANFSNNTYGTSSANKTEIQNFSSPFITSYEGKLNSRSNEVLNSSGLFSNAKSMSVDLQFFTSNKYSSPYVCEDDLDFRTFEIVVNNDSTNEAYSNGHAYSRYISRQVKLGNEQIAEDLIVYLDAYRPSGTDVEVYVKLLNEEDDETYGTKNWTKMSKSTSTGSVEFSVDSNPNDIIEFKYVIPFYQPGTLVNSGTFQTTLSSAVITGSYSTVNNDISAGNLVRVYSPTFPNTFFVETVTSSNTTTFTISKAVANSDVVGAGLLVEKITDKNSAFLNNQNYNVVRYFNSSMAKFDGFKNFAIKIVLLSDSYSNVPRVQNYRAIAVSA